MEKIFVIALMIILVATMFCGSVMASAPNSGDGVSDGSGWDGNPPQNGDPDTESYGPAPDSGDGIPDGSGF